MATLEQRIITEECIRAFKSGNKQVAEQLLPSIKPAVVRTTFQLRWYLLSELYSREPVAMVSLLHLAAYWGWKDIAICLVTIHKCVANWKDEFEYIPLHYAAYNGHLEVVKYFITELLCDPMDRNKLGDTPLHNACVNGHLNIIQYLISELHCNPSCMNNRGTTPLQWACFHNHAHIVQYLLSTGRVNPLAETKYPLYYATGKYDIIKLLQPFIDCNRDYPVHTFIKLILTGDSGAGKTTIAQHIELASSSSFVARWLLPAARVAEVERLTAGIFQHQIVSKLGNFVVYDFAGQQDYYSSHSAILELVMRRLAAVFLCVIDLSKSKEKICESLQYWLTFIDNASSTAEGTSHVVIIGSHADQVKLSKEMKEKSSLLQAIAVSRVRHQVYAGYVTMDCRYANTAASRRLISLITNSKEAITASQPAISCYCHVLYAFLRNKLDVVGCTLQDLISAIAKEKGFFSNDPSVLTELLTILSDKGLILFIQHPQSSWVFVKTEVLLNDINRTLFVPRHFKEHCDLASNTGIVPTSNLLKVFSQYNPDMLLNFLTSLNFCRPVDPSVLQYTNLQTTPSHSTGHLLFFPGLIQSERPDDLTQHVTLQFGWCLGCVEPNQFFGSRFLHLLLLSIAYRFPLAIQHNVSSSLRGLQRRCSVWKNGITWTDSDNITAVIELINKNRWVLVAMSCSEDRPVEHAKLRSALISLVHGLHQKQCPSLKVCEYLISPSLIQQYPLDDLPDTDLFDIQHVADSILCRKALVLSQKPRVGILPTQSLPLEPYHLISPSSVCQLFNSSMADQPVPVSILQEVQKHICEPSKSLLVCKDLRECLDSMSIFAGRNPLEVAMLKEEDLPVVPPTAGTGDPASILSIDNLFIVQKFVKQVVNWKDLGLALGLASARLQTIERNHHDQCICITKMLVAWLLQKDNVAKRGVPSWAVLNTALENIGENQVAISEIDQEMTKFVQHISDPVDPEPVRESPVDLKTVRVSPVDPETVMESPVDPKTVRESIKVTVIMHIIKIEAQGYPGTGKTSLLNLAMGKNSASTRNSTGFVEPPSRYMVSETSEGKWEELSKDMILEMISEEVKKVIDSQDMVSLMEYEQSAFEDKTTLPTENSSSVLTQAMTEISQPSVSPQSVSSLFTTPSISLQPHSNESSIKLLTDAAPPTTFSTLPQPDNIKKSNPYSVFSDLLKEVESIKHSTVIFSLKWVIVSDCGGQPPFLDASVFFLRNSSLRIIPLKLSDSLNENPDISYFVGGNNYLTDSYVPLTNLQTIETFAKSVAAIQPLCTEGAQDGRTCRCKFTIVGTFKDKEHKSESVEEKEKILKGVLQPYEFFQVCGDRIILPINAVVEPGPERDKAAADLRKLIETSETARKFEVKLCWFVFLLSLMKMAKMKNKAILSIKDDKCFELAESLGMEKYVTIKAIKFFHEIGLVMHFDGTADLEDYVVVDDEPVLGKISQLLSVSFIKIEEFNKLYASKHKHKQSHQSFFSETPPGETPLSFITQQTLQKYGRFSRRYLKFLNLTEKELDFFLKMLVHINAIAETIRNEEYFMPCALPYKEEPERPYEFPWIIKFRMEMKMAGVSAGMNYIPPPVGYLPALVVILVTEFSDEFRYQSGNKWRQYRNSITLAYKTNWRICIIERHLQLEIYFSDGCKFWTEFSNIRQCILEAISMTEKKLQIADTIERLDCFLCTCGKGSSSSSALDCKAVHVCVCYYDREKGYYAVCDESDQSTAVNPKCLFWMKAPGPDQTDQTKPATVTYSRQTGLTGGNTQPVDDPACGGGMTYQEVAGLKEAPSSILCINDLADVKRLLINFNDWKSLGLELGLLYTTLKRIEEEQQKVINNCKTEMLAAWLQQQDDVPKTGVPSWLTLKAALVNINEKKLADSIIIT